MNNRSPYRLFKIILIGTLMVGVVPPATDWEKAYATSKFEVVRSVDDIQQILLSAMNDRKDVLEFVYKGKTISLKTQIKQALDQAMQSDPYINYTIESYGYSYQGGKNSADVKVKLSYRETAQETAFVTKKVQSVLKKIIVPGMNDHEKVKVIHDWVVLNLKYDTTLRKYTAYDGLSTGSTVCQGYSLLTYKTLKEAGIKNMIVEGAVQSGGNRQLHAWNLVLVSGKWYHLDTTWDDPVPDQKNKVAIGYYLRNDEQMRKDHTWTKPYPAATTLYRNTLSTLVKQGGSKKAFYTKLVKELHYHLYESGEIVSSSAGLNTKVKKVISEGDHSILFRFHGSKDKLMEVLQGLYKLNIKGISYNYSDFENTGDLMVNVTWK
ncbi:transglutaminase domain-containing protein [Paenibacillus sp. IHBB 10380]|uniref:transglutaminase domain-containing protein n=1 Tax=Paenibacillus sp. IHBB 10380 TaxID=1566358 RepID=UPI0005CFB1FF|nr:transglutaminase domain-containing protein [Paenibacillus sp. IHBB 10380]AJS60156.1 transglutaminase [Paenibacillus sp. IHBB 10380]